MSLKEELKTAWLPKVPGAALPQEPLLVELISAGCWRRRRGGSELWGGGGRVPPRMCAGLRGHRPRSPGRGSPQGPGWRAAHCAAGAEPQITSEPPFNTPAAFKTRLWKAGLPRLCTGEPSSAFQGGPAAPRARPRASRLLLQREQKEDGRLGASARAFPCLYLLRKRPTPAVLSRHWGMNGLFEVRILEVFLWDTCIYLHIYVDIYGYI